MKNLLDLQDKQNCDYEKQMIAIDEVIIDQYYEE
jgi:hypothetical protein